MIYDNIYVKMWYDAKMRFEDVAHELVREDVHGKYSVMIYDNIYVKMWYDAKMRYDL